MAELKIEIDPAEVGFDATRLARIDSHFEHYVDDAFDGVGFGLGFSVVDDAVKSKVLSTVGDFGWGGAASTAFWVDPAEEITALFLTQLLPSSTHPIRSQLKQLVYQALVD